MAVRRQPGTRALAITLARDFAGSVRYHESRWHLLCSVQAARRRLIHFRPMILV